MSNIEFVIHEIQQEGETTRISGIVNKGVVPLNAEFVSVRSQTGSEKSISLKVLSILAYRRQIPELPTGMSGELHVRGEGADQLQQHFVLMD